ncbi:MAG: hypothetical protein HUU50_09075 [Candidatus Brocadiae bacterium]|nr:hypothetical protein [Candidatus Brocadiia bacterium]
MGLKKWWNKEVKPVFKKVEEAPKKAGKEIKRTSERIEKEIEKTAKQLGKEIDRGRLKIDRLSQEWNEWREDTLDPIGDYISFFYNALKEGITEGFPKGFEVNKVSKLENPDVDMFVSSTALNRGLARYLKDAIPLDKKNPHSNNYINIGESSLSFDEGRNIIICKIAKGMLGFEKAKTKGGLRLNGATIEIAPVLKKRDSQIILEIYTKMIYLDINDTPPLIERSIAQGIDEYLKDEGALASENITDMIDFKIPVLNTKKSLFLSISDASLFVENGGIRFQAKYKIAGG